jgi:YVTN family beta-propeller protein
MKGKLLSFAILALLLGPRAFSQKLITTVSIGGQPGQLAVNGATNMIYVPNTTLNSVSVINGNSNQIVASIPLGAAPFAAAVNPTTNLVYVTVPASSVVVIDGASNVVTATIPATNPLWIAVNPVTNLAYFSSTSSDSSSVSVINGTNNQIVKTLSLATNCCVAAVAVNTTTNQIYVADDFSTEQVVVIDGNTNEFRMFAIPGLCNLIYMAVDSSLNRIYGADSVCGGLYVVNGANDKLLTTVLPKDTGPIAVNPTNHEIADFAINVLTFLNGRTDAVTGTTVSLPTSLQAANIAANNKNRYYVSLYKATGIAVISGPKSQ